MALRDDDTVHGLLRVARALRAEHPSLHTPGTAPRTWRDLDDTTHALAHALLALGLARGDRVLLLARHRRESVEALLALGRAGLVAVTLPPALDAATLAALARAASPAACVVDDPAALAALFEALPRDAWRALRRVVTFDLRAALARPDARGRTELTLDHAVPVAERARVTSWHELSVAGRRLAASTQELPPPAPDDVFARVVTAGRGGARRLVAVTHARAFAAAGALALALPVGVGDAALSHVDEGGFVALARTLVALRAGAATVFARDLASSDATVLVTSAARMEALRDEALEALRGEGPARRAVVERAVAVGLEHAAMVRDGATPSALLRAQHRAARAAALDSLRARFGARLRFALVAGSSLSSAAAEWFDACGVTALHGYGLAEAAGLTHVERPDARRAGTVGAPLHGVEATVDDGELVLRGPGLEGAVRTGDLAALDADAWLRLRGRR